MGLIKNRDFMKVIKSQEKAAAKAANLQTTTAAQLENINKLLKKVKK